MTEASWRTHPFYTNYEVSNTGLVRRRTKARGAIVGKILKPTPKDGYASVYLAPQRHRRGVHCLVLEAFVGPRPDGMQCRHLNGVRTDNSLENLSWGTRQQNYADSVIHGTSSRGERNGLSRLTARDVADIRCRHASGSITQYALANEYCVSHTTMGRIIQRRMWKHVV